MFGVREKCSFLVMRYANGVIAREKLGWWDWSLEPTRAEWLGASECKLNATANSFTPSRSIEMLAFTASSVGTLPLVAPVKTRNGCKSQKETSCSPVSVSTQLQPYDHRSGLNMLVLSPIGLGKQLHPIYGRKHCNRKQSASITCSAAMNARCSASGQTQTVTREAPTITKAPVRACGFSNCHVVVRASLALNYQVPRQSSNYLHDN
ncbi:hypothetical protein GH714_028239 [Hevea brasiliensis]|uniref:Uncharacterized protein n=1 Tax=Hevea brasiliensis TaxID=3981 RepID=A0A6A6LBN4_HEVBR|nr:hypothetical protein GH714_028239 [Hevea brasiliensis]